MSVLHLALGWRVPCIQTEGAQASEPKRNCGLPHDVDNFAYSTIYKGYQDQKIGFVNEASADVCCREEMTFMMAF